MPDREKVIKGLDEVWEYMSKNVKDIASRKARMMDKVADACNLLKEQEDLGTELTNAVELIHKKNERIEKLLKEQEAVVRCKDCRFGEPINDRYICTNAGHCQSKSNEPDWFCADGERKEGR